MIRLLSSLFYLPKPLSDHLLHYILTLFEVSVVLKSLSATTPVVRDISAGDSGKGGRWENDRKMFCLHYLLIALTLNNPDVAPLLRNARQQSLPMQSILKLTCILCESVWVVRPFTSVQAHQIPLRMVFKHITVDGYNQLLCRLIIRG